MQTVTQISNDLQALFSEHADSLGREVHLIQRQRVFTAHILAQTLVFGWLQNPNATLAELACMASALGADVTQQALNRRFNPTCAQFLLTLLTTFCRRSVESPVAADPWRGFSAVFVLDSSVVMLPKELQAIWKGCGGSLGANAGLKLNTRLDLKSGQLSLALSDAKTHDACSPLAAEPLEPDSLRIADLGYFKLPQLHAYHQQGVSWLSRLKVGTLWSDEAGQTVDLLELLAKTSESTLERPGLLGKRRIPARLFAYRVSPEQERRRHAGVVHRAQRKVRPPSRERLALSGWTLLVTNAPSLSATAAYELYRARWQIELLFKRWKQQGRLASWRSENPWRILCEVYAKLIGLVLLQWVCVGAGWTDGRRSLVKMEREIRKYALWLVLTLSDAKPVAPVLTRLRRSLGKAIRTESRRKHPATFQALQVLDDP